MTPGPFKISSTSLGFNNGRGHQWIVRSARDTLGFKRGMLVKDRAKNPIVLFGKINRIVSWTDD